MTITFAGGSIRTEAGHWQRLSFVQHPDQCLLAIFREMAEQVDILYIEDSAMDAMVLQMFARKAGYERVVVVPTALDGITVARDKSPRLILADLHLPGVNGIELVQMLKQDPATSRIPVLVLSSDNDRSHMRLAQAAGADHFLFKPLGLKQMTQLFNQYLAAGN